MVSELNIGCIKNEIIFYNGRFIPANNEPIKYSIKEIPKEDDVPETETLKQAKAYYRKNGKKYAYEMTHRPREILEKPIMRPCLGHWCLGLKKFMTTKNSRLCPRCSHYAETVDQYSTGYNEKEVG